MHKYDIIETLLQQALQQADGHHIAAHEMIEAIIVAAVQHSARLRGVDATRTCLNFELAALNDEIEFDLDPE